MIFSTMGKMLSQMVGMGLVMGIVFPIYAGFFVNWIPERKIYFSIGCLIAGLVVGVVNFFIANHTLLKPLRLIIRKTEQAAQGDLTAKIDLGGSDIVGLLATSINNLFQNTEALILQVKKVTNHITSASQELHTIATKNFSAVDDIVYGFEKTFTAVEQAAQDQNITVQKASDNLNMLDKVITEIAMGAQHQAEQMSIAAQKTHEMSLAVQEIENNSVRFAEQAKTTQKSASSSYASINGIVERMGKINSAVTDANTKVQVLGQQSKQIGAIIEVIEGIAEQTNLLALNAAIESARAGEFGKGFAVVADEVRKLAEMTGKSTKEIAQLIISIQKLTNGVITSIEAGSVETALGSELASETSQVLNDILNNVSQTNNHIIEISSALNQITQSSHSVIQVIDNVTTLTEQNTASTEEMSANSQFILNSLENISFNSSRNKDAVQQVSLTISGIKVTSEDTFNRAKQLELSAEDLQSAIDKFTVGSK